LVAIVVVVNAGYLVGLIDYVLVGGGQGFVLVKAAMLIWVTNVVAFAVWHWEVDRRANPFHTVLGPARFGPLANKSSGGRASECVMVRELWFLFLVPRCCCQWGLWRAPTLS
jgi:hypothetical protein